LTPTNSFLLLGVYTSVSNLVKIDKKCDRESDRQTQTDFIICPMLYAIAMGQIIIKKRMHDKITFVKFVLDSWELKFMTSCS